MRIDWRPIAVVVFLFIPGFGEAQQSVTVTVPSTSDPWLAGMPPGSGASGSFPGAPPQDFAPAESPAEVGGLVLVPGSTLILTATGEVANGPDLPFTGPDGRPEIVNHFAGTENGIPDISAGTNALLGVFLDDNQPDTEVGLREIVLIGSSATVRVPAGATRLFLGVMDGYGWSNNLGSFAVTITSVQTDPAFDISVTAFIPGNSIDTFTRQCVTDVDSVPVSRSLLVKTDDRWFDPAATTYRSRQVVTVIADQDLDEDGLKEASGTLLTQPTLVFASDALPVIDQDDHDAVLGDCSLLHAIEGAAVNYAQITVARVGPKRVRVRLNGDVSMGPAVGLGLDADISWRMTLWIDTSGPSPVVTIEGSHDGFPAYEVYVNNQTIYTYASGVLPYQRDDLLQLAGPPAIEIDRHQVVIR